MLHDIDASQQFSQWFLPQDLPHPVGEIVGGLGVR